MCAAELAKREIPTAGKAAQIGDEATVARSRRATPQRLGMARFPSWLAEPRGTMPSGGVLKRELRELPDCLARRDVARRSGARRLCRAHPRAVRAG